MEFSTNSTQWKGVSPMDWPYVCSSAESKFSSFLHMMVSSTKRHLKDFTCTNKRGFWGPGIGPMWFQ